MPHSAVLVLTNLADERVLKIRKGTMKPITPVVRKKLECDFVKLN